MSTRGTASDPSWEPHIAPSDSPAGREVSEYSRTGEKRDKKITLPTFCPKVVP